MQSVVIEIFFSLLHYFCITFCSAAAAAAAAGCCLLLPPPPPPPPPLPQVKSKMTRHTTCSATPPPQPLCSSGYRCGCRPKTRSLRSSVSSSHSSVRSTSLNVFCAQHMMNTIVTAQCMYIQRRVVSIRKLCTDRSAPSIVFERNNVMNFLCRRINFFSLFLQEEFFCIISRCERISS